MQRLNWDLHPYLQVFYLLARILFNLNPFGLHVIAFLTFFDIFGFYNSVTQSSDNHSGSSAAKVEIVDFGGNPIYPFMFADSIGVSERHGSLNGYYKFMPQSDKVVLDIAVFMSEGAVFNFIGGGF